MKKVFALILVISLLLFAENAIAEDSVKNEISILYGRAFRLLDDFPSNDRNSLVKLIYCRRLNAEYWLVGHFSHGWEHDNEVDNNVSPQMTERNGKYREDRITGGFERRWGEEDNWLLAGGQVGLMSRTMKNQYIIREQFPDGTVRTISQFAVTEPIDSPSFVAFVNAGYIRRLPARLSLRLQTEFAFTLGLSLQVGLGLRF